MARAADLISWNFYMFLYAHDDDKLKIDFLEIQNDSLLQSGISTCHLKKINLWARDRLLSENWESHITSSQWLIRPRNMESFRNVSEMALAAFFLLHL